MPIYKPIRIYDEGKVHSHAVYTNNIEEIKKWSLDTFLHNNGIFGGIVEHALAPEGNSVLATHTGYGYEMEYRTTRKNQEIWNTIWFHEHNIVGNESEATTQFLLKAFELIVQWNIYNIKVI